MPEESYIRISITELRKLAREAGKAGAQAAMGTLADRQDRVVQHIDRSGAYKATMNTQEAKAYAGVSERTIRRWIHEGLPANNRGGRAGYSIAKADIDGWLAGNRAQDRPAIPGASAPASAPASAEGVVAERRP